jgi:hypothetical protein
METGHSGLDPQDIARLVAADELEVGPHRRRRVAGYDPEERCRVLQGDHQHLVSIAGRIPLRDLIRYAVNLDRLFGEADAARNALFRAQMEAGRQAAGRAA